MKKTGQNYNTKYYLNSKRRGKNKQKELAMNHLNYRTSTSSWSNNSYLNSSVMSNPIKGTAYTDVFPIRGKREANRPIKDYDGSQVRYYIQINFISHMPMNKHSLASSYFSVHYSQWIHFRWIATYTMTWTAWSEKWWINFIIPLYALIKSTS